jgi:hypothetical protein
MRNMLMTDTPDVRILEFFHRTHCFYQGGAFLQIQKTLDKGVKFLIAWDATAGLFNRKKMPTSSMNVISSQYRLLLLSENDL